MGDHELPDTDIRAALAEDLRRMGLMDPEPVELVNKLDTVWSPDMDAYTAGQLDVSKVRCVLCGHAPCDCPEFGTSEYFAMVDRLHGRGGW